jgi:hypothetical protein
VRVAVSGEVFDDHTDSHTLFSYGGAFFERVMAESQGNVESADGPGVCWKDAGGAIAVQTVEGVGRPETLGELRACLRKIGEPAEAPEAGLRRIV